MNKFVLGFVFLILTSRFFTETIAIAPKGVDLLDVAIIPLLCSLALVKDYARGVDRKLHGKLLYLVGAFLALSILSALVNHTRTGVGPLVLFVFGMLEGPLLYLCLNRLIRDKGLFGEQTARFINVLLIAEIVVVLFISYPRTIATGNPDLMSGTFGNNSYQFTALLIIIGGYFVGRQFARPRVLYVALGIQFFVIMTFLLLQYRTAVPAFFLAYAVLITILYGKRFIRLAALVIPIAFITYFGFSRIASSNLDLKYEDLLILSEDLGLLTEYGKFLSYANTIQLYQDHPLTILFGTGPGTYVSRANYTFTVEIASSQGKGVGGIITSVFGEKNYFTDVHIQYIHPLYQLETLFGSMQINNPNSSILAAAGELGLPGLFVLGGIYALALRRSLGYLRYARRERDPVILPLASALVVGMVYLCLISPLDNYMEIARVTIPNWLLFWTVSTLVRRHREQRHRELLIASGHYVPVRLTSHGIEPVVHHPPRTTAAVP